MIPYFINPHQFRIAVPNAMGSSTSVPPGGLVKGTYYNDLALIGLLDEYNGVVDPLNVYYVYPEGSGGGSGSGSDGITDIIAGTGITVDIVGTEATISLSPGSITSSMIADGTIVADDIAGGEVVKSVNGYHDAIVLIDGAGSTVVTTFAEGETRFAIDVDAPGLTATAAVTPLSLSLSNGNQTLNGSISITATHDGGAIAKQTLPIISQTGHIGLTGNIYDIDGIVRLNSTEDDTTVVADTIARLMTFVHSDYRYLAAFLNKDATIFVDDADDLPIVASLSPTGLFRAAGLISYGNITAYAEDLNEVFAVDALDTLANSSISFYAKTDAFNTITLEEGASIEGTVFSLPLETFTTSSVTVPAILVENVTNTANALALQTKDNTNAITAQLDTNGNLFVKSIDVAGISTPPIFLVGGSYAVDNYDEKVFIFDCASTATTVELPELTVGGVVKNGTLYTFAKYDATTNAVLIAPSNGQQINGQTTLTLSTQGQSANIMAVVQSSPSPATFWITVGKA